MNEAAADQDACQALARVVSDVLVLVTARQQRSIERLDYLPSEAGVIGCADDQLAPGLRHAVHFPEQYLVIGDMVDYLRADRAIESRVSERQGKGRTTHQLDSPPPAKSATCPCSRPSLPRC